MKKIFTLLFLLVSLFSFSQSTTVVISQVYGGGGANSGTPTYKNDYVELHNVSNTTQSLDGMSIQYGSSAGNFGSSSSNIYAFPAGTSIPAGGYLLIQLGAAGTAGADLPVTPDIITTNLTMSATSGKVALANQATTLGCGATASPCTLPGSVYVDVVAYGAANNAEGNVSVNNGAALTNAQGSVRKGNGCTDTDNNNADFDVVGNPVPRNSSSPVNICGGSGVLTPTVSSISPTSATAGGSGFTLTVDGTNFINGSSTVTWNGSNRTTTFVSSTQLTASIPASDIATAGTAYVGVTTTGAASPSNTVSFTINAASTPALSASTITAFGNACINTTSTPNSFTITGSNLTTADVTVGPLAGYSFSTTSGGTYSSSLTLTQPGGPYSQQVFVQFTPTTVQNYDGNIPVSGGGATAISVAASGAGINTAPTVTTGSATAITTTGADLPGTITDNGCGTISSYGIEYSTTNGFANGSGTQVTASNLSSGNFSVTLNTLSPSTTYYYKAYATNGGGTSYGTQQSFTTSAAPPAGAPVATAATAITSTGFTANWNAVAGATGYRLDVYTSAGGSSTSTIAGWNFGINNATSQTADVGNANNIGIQTVTSNGLNTISWPSGPSGASGTPNPYSVSGNGWDNGADTKYWQIDLNTTGATNITLSSLQGSSSTGPSAFKVQYKVGAGGTWNDVPGGTVTLTTGVVGGNLSTFVALTDLPLPSAVDNQSLVSIRWISTSNTAVNSSAISAAGTSRISAIYVKGTTGGSSPVYVTGYQDLAVGDVTSYNVTGLTANTTYYYVVRAENGSGTSANSNEITVMTNASPSLTASALTSFGNVCTNTTSTPNSFTITGSNLTTTDVTVGPLAGYSFSTTSAGTYSPSLTLSQPGGSYSQQVFVQFNPTSVQSYDGNIPVSGGGATAIDVAVTGSGVNTAPTVVTGSASSITTTSADAAGSITATGCTAITAYGIEYSTTSGFANGTGTQAPSSNLSGGNFSRILSLLAPGTTYYYKAYATNAGGTSYGAEQSFTTVSVLPTISTTSTTGFGNVCVNTPSVILNDFTITGTNLTNADITVGPLAGYSFATVAGGPFSNTLTLTQPGGSYSQQIFVQFTPTAVQSYNGNIPVSGGGTATTTNVAVTGAGVNSAPTLTTGASSAITFNSATLVGTIANTGCTAVTAYGIEYSTTNGFANGTGTQVASTNLSGGNFTSGLSGLAPSTTYYYKSYATNGGGTGYGTQQSFTTAAPPPATLSATTLTAFGSTCVGTPVGPNTFTITGVNLTAGNITVGPLNGYTFATTANGTYSNSLTIPTTGGAFSQQVFVKFSPATNSAFNGNIPVSGGGATAINVAATGTGVSTPPSVTTGGSSNITTSSATLAGSLSDIGCSNTVDYGIEYSGINNFANGTGTQVSAGSVLSSAANFSVNVNGLIPGATYYYKAYARNSGGTAYGTQQSFTVAAIPNAFTVFPVPVRRGHALNFSMNNLRPGFYGIVLINSAGQEVYKKGFNIQVGFINDHITIPYSITNGVYRVRIITNTDVLDTKTILIED